MGIIESKVDHLVFNADGASKDIKFQANGVEKASISSAGAFTSTTIDATKLTGNLPAIDGSSLTNLPAGGKVLQVVSETKTDTASTTSTSFTDITGLSASITPSSTSSEILIITKILISQSNNYADGWAKIVRDSTPVGNGSSGFSLLRGGETTEGNMTHLDSPATTSSITYKTQVRTETGTMYINSNDGSGVYSSSITLIEIGA